MILQEIEQPLGLFARDLFERASDYMEAYRVLGSHNPDLGYPRNYLLAHALELFLKSFLATKSFSRTRMAKLGHDLRKLVNWSKEHGLPDVENLHELCQRIANMNSDHDFRYPTGYILYVPATELCWPVLVDLKKALEPIIGLASFDAGLQLASINFNGYWKDPLKPKRRRRTSRKGRRGATRRMR